MINEAPLKISTPKINSNLQKLVDFKLMGVSPSMDAMDDYYENYCQPESLDPNSLSSLKIKLEDFISIKATAKEISTAILNSKRFNKEFEKWKNKFAKEIAFAMKTDILGDSLNLKEDIDSEKQEEERVRILKTAHSKLKKAGLSQKEKRALGVYGMQ